MTQDNGISWQELKEERDALAAHVAQLSEALEDITQAAQQEGLQFSGWREQVDNAVTALLSSPTTNLALLKAQWQADLVNKVKTKDLATNNGDLRRDFEWRDGWNTCLSALRSQAEGGE